MTFSMIICNTDITREVLVTQALYFDRLIVVTYADNDRRPYQPPDMVPTGMPVASSLYRYDPETLRLYRELRDAGLLIEVPLTIDDRNIAAKPLIDFVTAHGEELRATQMKFNEAWPKSREFSVVHHYEDFLSPALAWALVEEGVGFYKQMSGEGNALGFRLRLPWQLSSIYCSLVVEFLSRKTSANLSSRSISPYIDPTAWTEGTLAGILLREPLDLKRLPNVTEASHLGLFSINAVMPERVFGQLTAQSIVDIRDRRRDELTNFQDYVDSLTTLAGLNEDNIDEDFLHLKVAIEYERKIQPSLRALRRDLRGLDISATIGSLSIKTAVPASVAAAISAILPGGDLTHIATIGAGVSVGLGNFIADIRKRRHETVRSNAASYLLEFTETKPENVLKKVREIRFPLGK
jgi:hypothetical protein